LARSAELHCLYRCFFRGVEGNCFSRALIRVYDGHMPQQMTEIMYAARYNLSIYAYCLMTNHIHLVAAPADETALGKALRDAHTLYALYFNTRTTLSGHVKIVSQLSLRA